MQAVRSFIAASPLRALGIAAIAASWGLLAYVNLAASPDLPLKHISQSEASAKCRTGAALAEEVRRESGGDFHYYPCYGGGIVDAFQ